MTQPNNYILDIPNPLEAMNQGIWNGIKLGSTIDQVKQQTAQAELQAADKARIQRELYEFQMIPEKKAEDFTNFTTRNPQYSEQFKMSWDILNERQRQQALSTAAQVMSAIKTGNTTVAQDFLEEQAKAFENSGKKESAFNMRRMKGMISKDPNSIYVSLGLFGNAVSPDEFSSMMDKMDSGVRADQLQPIAVAQGNANVAQTKAQTGKIAAETQGQTIENRYKPQQLQGGIDQTQSQIALNYANIQNMADRFGLDRDKLETETSLKFQELNPTNIKLSDSAQKIINDNMTEAVGLEQSASRMNDLANRFEKEDQAGGLFTKGWAGFKRVTGWSNDDQNAMIREYTRLRNSEAIKSLPPGPATDKDIELALKGLPPETADSTTVTSFLRGYAKLNQRDAAYKQMQAEWVNQVGNMGSSKRDVEILGVKVPSGTTFSGYATKNLDKTLKTQAKQSVQRQISTGSRSYLSAVQ